MQLPRHTPRASPPYRDMDSETVQISIPVEACELALRGPIGGEHEQASLPPATRMALERASMSPAGIPLRDGVFTPEQARDLYDYFCGAADYLTSTGKSGAVACSQAFDNVAQALDTAGIAISRVTS